MHIFQKQLDSFRRLPISFIVLFNTFVEKNDKQHYAKSPSVLKNTQQSLS